MAHFACLVPAGGPAERRTAELERRLVDHHAAQAPGDASAVTVSWRTAPAGMMFTEGRPSTSSLIGCVLPFETTLRQRERYMRGVCDIWTEVTGCTDHEVVVSVTEIEPDRED